MKNLDPSGASRIGWFDSLGREDQVRDYFALTTQLIWQRQASYFAAAILGAIYFDPLSTFVLYSIVILTEVLDQLLARQAENWDTTDLETGKRLIKRIAVNTVISATAISVFIVNLAVQQTSGGHFTPLFFLFSASLFAAMYNSQMIGVLLLRLAIYACAFLFIAFIDVIRYAPPLSSHIWLEVFTVLFVLYFIIDISMKFYGRYQERIGQMRVIEAENKRTRAALEVKSQFLSTVSHELRTPLTSIRGSLELVNSGVVGEVPDTIKPVIDIAVKNGQRLAALINDLLDLQKIENGEIAFQFAPIDANDLVDEAIRSIAGYASKLGHSVEMVRSKSDCQIMGDNGRLNQVMDNLLSNALKFSKDAGTVKVRVDRLGDRVRISVHDRGVGIPKDAEDRVFGRFSQVDSSDVRKVDGTGLGLNITKQIVERHDATIDYVSELGVGTTFYVEFQHHAQVAEPAPQVQPIAATA